MDTDIWFAVTWEGPNALEEVASLLPAKAATRRKALQSDAEEPSESENVQAVKTSTSQKTCSRE